MHLPPPEDDENSEEREATRELIDRLRREEPRAWEQLERRYANLFKLIARRSAPREYRRMFESGDCVQSALMIVYRELDKFEYRGPGSFRKWLVTIVSNRMNQRLRYQRAAKRDARRQEHVAGLENAIEDSDANAHPTTKAETAEWLAKLLEAITALPDEHRMVIEAYFYEDASFAKIGAALSYAEATARRRFAEALVMLGRDLGAGAHGPL